MNKTKKRSKKLFAAFLTVIMLFTLIPIMPADGMKNVEASATLKNPRRGSNGKVTYDCVWFGSYPQAEVITTAMSKNYTAIGRKYLKKGDLIVDDTTYGILKNVSGWDANGDITLSNGDRYRRMKKDDATAGYSGRLCNYNWSDSQTYHYFKYQPIKWRVLSIDGNEALLMADKGLDDRAYNIEWEEITWETCTMRSFLNGYGSTSNKQKEDYTKKNFINSAFTSDEKKLIKKKALENKDKSGKKGGNNPTKDKIFLLSYDDVTNSGYGFSSDYSNYDKAKCIQGSTYARAMGASWYTGTAYSGNSCWWLRSPDYSANYAMYVNSYGYVYRYSDDILSINDIMVPALYIRLSTSNCYSYAGTVCTDGRIREENSPVTIRKNGLIKENGIYYYYKNNKKQTGYTGMVKNRTNGKWYYVKKGRKKYVTQLVKHTDGSWWYVKNSKWQPKFTGIVKQPSGRRYYVEKGKRKNRTGYVTVKGKKYKLIKGEVK